MAARRSDPGRVALRCTGAVAAIAAETYICSQWIYINPTTIGFVYLVTILLVATFLGLVEALLASLLATLCFNFFFFPPRGTFNIDDPLNWVSLVAFLVTSVVASQLSERARRRTREAEIRQLEMERLYAVSRAMLVADPRRPLTEQLARDLARIYELPFVAVYDRANDQVHQGGPQDAPELVARLKEAALLGSLHRDDEQRTIVMAVSFGGHSVGGLALKGVSLSDTALQALSNLVSLGMERSRDREAAIRADAARQSEEFKSTLMDALAHEFKTPLTSIKAAVTAVQSSTVQKPEEQGELLDVIGEATDRLSGLVTETIRLARIEAGDMRLRKEAYSMKDAVNYVLSQMKAVFEARPVEVSVGSDLPPILADPELVRLVLHHLFDNAVKYSPPASPISISVRRENGFAVVGIRNQGDGIAEWERSRIFEKFYRGSSVRNRVPGTGMGLAIVREVVHAHGGHIRVESAPGQGAEFVFSLPLIREEAQR